MAEPSMAEEILKHQQAEKIIEELLDIALSTLNTVNIDPHDGEQLANYFVNKSLHNHEAVDLLLKIDLAAEPDKTRKTLNKYGIVKEA
jgi:ankyrin repeat protein